MPTLFVFNSLGNQIMRLLINTLIPFQKAKVMYVLSLVVRLF